MARPSQRSQSAERIVVEQETAPGSGAFRVDDRLLVEAISIGSDDVLSTAQIAVRLDDAFGAVEARQRYHADLRLMARTDHVDPIERVILFDGYPSAQETDWESREQRERWTFGFEAEHAYARLARLRETQIFGRHVRNGAIEDGLIADPITWRDKSVLLSALPCLFNLDGVPNCDPTPLTIALPSGQTRSVHIFTADDESGAIAWTFATALRYLVWFYRSGEGPVDEGNVFSATDDYVTLTPADGDGLDESDPLGRAMVRAPESLVCEATNLVEALGALADAAGVHITSESVNVNGQPRTQLRLWSPAAGSIRWLALARGGVDASGQPRYDTTAKRADQVLADNNTYRARFTWDHTRIVNAPIVVGGIKRYEMTVELSPGWLPETNLDNVDAPNRAAAKALALTREEVEALGPAVVSNTWFRNYHRQGSDFKFNAHVARRWVLNEDGRYDANLYNRNAPFDDYRPFDFSTVTDASVTTPGAWMRRARRLDPPITRVVEGHGLGVWVEISFDSGSTWHQQASGVRVLDDQAGITFEAETPTDIAPAGVDPRQQNLWYALVDQTLRVRVTAVVESDDRLIHVIGPDQATSPTVQAWSRLVYRPDAFEFASRVNTTNVLASVNPNATDIGRDDADLARALAVELLETHQDRRVHATPAIPWLDTEYSIGDRLAGVRGQGLSLATTIGPKARYPAIIGKRYRLTERRYETELRLERTEVGA